MSASDKKKLRAAERAEKLTEKQLAEQKEAKKLKIMTTVFVVVLALMVCFAVFTAVTKTIEGSGVREKNTVALTIDGHEISNAELNYYFIDSVNNFYSQYGAYAAIFGLDTTKPLNEQVTNEETGETWADDFLNSAVETAKAVYALNDAANAAGFTLSEDQQAEIDTAISNTEINALYYYGYASLEDYLRAMYGYGADEEGFRAYVTMSYIADAYQTFYSESLTYEDADLREAEAENYNAYTSYSYNYYYLDAEKFVDAGEDVSASDYTDEQLAQGLASAEDAAKALTAEDINSVEALDAAIAALPINAEVENAASTASTDVLYSSVSATFSEWVTDSAREAGNITYIPNSTTSTDENGNETTTTEGYYVVLFNGSNDNNFGMANVRHILAAFEGGTYDSTTGLTTYTDEEKAAAKLEAELILKDWQSGKTTEESFAQLANEKSDDGDGTTGGLYENINPSSNYVTNFKNWALEGHEVGDTGIVESPYGYHVMYYCGESEMTYRDYMIETDLRSADFSDWYNGMMEGVVAEQADTRYIRTDLVLSNG